MKKNYGELINTLCDFHTIALIDNSKDKNSKWIITLNRVCKMLYDTDYFTFLRDFPVNKPVVMPGALEAQYNLIDAVINYNKDLTSIKAHAEMYECAKEVKMIFDDFLYRNKYKIHKSQVPNNKAYSWYNITPII